MVALDADLQGERAAEVGSRAQAFEDVTKVVLWAPSEAGHGAGVDVHAIDLREERPAARLIELGAFGKQPMNDVGRVVTNSVQIIT